MKELGAIILSIAGFFTFLWLVFCSIGAIHGGSGQWVYVQPENLSYCVYLHIADTPDARLSCGHTAQQATDAADDINNALRRARQK